MHKLFTTALLYLMALISAGQQYSSAKIIKRADSTLISIVGQKNFEEHFEIDSSSYFNTKTSSGVFQHHPLLISKKTNSELVQALIRYRFYIKKYEDPVVITALELDKSLNLIKPVDTSLIPVFILKNLPNDFLTYEDVVSLAKTKFEKPGLRPVETTLLFDYSRKKYIWQAINIIREWKINDRESYKEIESLDINAVTGEILNFSPYTFIGPLH